MDTSTEAFDVFSEQGVNLAAEPSVTDRFELLGEVGRGGMGIVYRARHKLLDRTVAIKVMRPGGSSARLAREARLLAKVRSPHVVAIHDVVVLPSGHPLLVMEWVEGDPLSVLIPDRGSLPEAQVLPWMRQTCEGMLALAEQGVIHRDLKPSNLLIDSQRHARVADFGLAREPAAADDLSHSSLLMGTPLYMAPEQADDPRSVDTRADVYSFGATFYHALTGRPPFSGPTALSILLKHQTEPLIPPRVIRPDLSPRTSQVLERCLAKNRDARFSSFAEVLAALEAGAELPFPAAAQSPRAALFADIRRFSGHLNAVTSLVFSPDGRRVVSGGEDYTARLWDIGTGEEVRRFDAQQCVCGVGFSPDGRCVLSANADKLVLVWEVDSGREVRRWKAEPDASARAAVPPDNRHTRLRFSKYTRPRGSVSSAAFSADGHRVVLGSIDSTLSLWDVESGQELRRFQGHEGVVRSAAISPDARHVLSGGEDQTVRLWDTDSGEELHCFRGHGDAVFSVAFSPSGCRALSGSEDSTMRLWDLQTGRLLRLYEHQRGTVVWSVAFSPDGRRALSGAGARLRLWDVDSGRELHCFLGHGDAVWTVAFSPDGSQALSGSYDQSLRLWDVIR
jgi:predicted Ser/Thr protein kinase